MKIDEKWLEVNLEATIRLSPKGGSCHTRDEALELLRLARLGLWAEKYGVPALRLITRKMPGLVSREEAADMAMEFKMGATSALIVLPKDAP